MSFLKMDWWKDSDSNDDWIEDEDEDEDEDEYEIFGFLFEGTMKNTVPIKKNGCYWFLLGDILDFLRVPERRRRGAWKSLMGKKQIELLARDGSNKKREYYIHGGFIEEYVNIMRTKLAIGKKYVEAMNIWQDQFCGEFHVNSSARRRKKEEEEWEREEGESSVVVVDNDFSHESISNSEKEKEKVDPIKRQKLMEASSCILASGAEIIRMLPSSDTKQKASILAEMLNQFEILKALHPSRTGIIPSFPPTGSQIRVSDRLRQYDLEPNDVEQDEYKQIGEVAALNYRNEYGVSPWRVPVWVGQEMKTTYFYTESTCKFIDEAIEEILDL